MYQKTHINRFERFFSSTCRALSARLTLLATVALAFFAVSVEAQPFTENPAYSAAYKDLYRTGEGIFVELLSEGRALVYLFTYSPAGTNDDGPGQAWMVGVGVQVPGGVEVDEMFMPTGGRFGPGFDRDDVVYTPFGSLSFRFPTCGSSAQRGVLHVFPQPATGFENLTSWEEGGYEGNDYIQLTQMVDCDRGEDAYSPANSYYSGSWRDPLHAGEGLIVEVLPDGRAVVQWLTYDDVGRQMWVQGVGNFDGSVLTVNELNTYTGTHWGRDFKPEEVIESEFGSLTIEFNGCEEFTLNKGTMHYDTLAFGSGTWNIERLTTLSAFSLWPAYGCWDY